jgi:lysine/ornithine N-monooxygenase
VSDIDLLIVGAGPYGLAIAAYAKHRGLRACIVGEPMGFWKHNMPARMLLRSGVDWHLDPLETLTFEAFLRERSVDPASVMPIPVGLFLQYAEWFRAGSGLEVVQDFVVALRAADSKFEADLASGGHVAARRVVVATGYKPYKSIPQEIVAGLPPERFAHTCDLVEFSALHGKRCLVVGGRQSAFEWACLINEECAAEVHVVYRHDAPRFEASDWSWINKHVEETLAIRGWYRNLPETERQAVDRQFWETAKLKLEPWLWDRLGREGIMSWPRRSVAGCQLTADGQIEVNLDNQSRLRVDFLVLATGFVVDILREPLISDQSIVSRMQIVDGYPVLDESFQSTLPGLYLVGLTSTRDFGPFFGFVRGCTAAARLLVDSLIA